ncbi:MAG: YlbF family regulator [Phycisphaerae bacterium]
MDEILELATKLGKLIQAHPTAERLAKARSHLGSGTEGRRLLQDYETAQNKVRELEAKGSPIEPEDERALVDLHAKVAGSQLIKEFMKAQMEYAELMRAVATRIKQEVNEPEPLS